MRSASQGTAIRPAPPRRARTLRLAGAFAAAAATIALISGATVPSAAGDSAAASPRSVAVDAKLLDQLSAKPTERVLHVGLVPAR